MPSQLLSLYRKLRLTQFVVVAGVIQFSPGNGMAGDPRLAQVIRQSDSSQLPESESGIPRVFVSAFRGSIGKTTADLVRKDFERGDAVNVDDSENSDSYVINGEATGGWIDAVAFEPGGRVFLRRRYESPNLRQNVHRLSDDVTEILTGKPAIASSVIAFVSDRTGGRQVYLCDSDGEDIRRVTNEDGKEGKVGIESHMPSVTLTAKRVAYSSVKKGYSDVYTIDLATGETKRIINAPGNNEHPVISPDGTRIALTMTYAGTHDLYVTSIEGGRGRRLTDDAEIESSPTWSPDGRHLAFEKKSNGKMPAVYYVSSVGGIAERLPTGESGSSQPDWSPDGHAIAFVDDKDGTLTTIAIFDVGTQRATSLEGTTGGHSPSWAPDSRHLAFVNGEDLWVIDTQGRTSRKIVQGFGNVSQPFWSR